MQRLHLVTCLLEPLTHLLSHHDAAVLTAGASKSYGEVTLPLLHIMWKQVEHHVGYAVQKLIRLRKLAHIRGHLGIEAGQLAKLRHKVRIGEEPHIEYHIRVQWYAVFEAETEAGDEQPLRFFLLPEPGLDVGTQFMHIEVRSVDQS